MKKSILLFTLGLAITTVSAQDISNRNAYIHRPFQVSFIAPVGSNGIEGSRVVNNFSFNILSGYAAGLEGLEIGGLANVELDYMKGIQFGGLTNVVLGRAKGVQFGGILNYAGKNSKAVQFGGIANVVIGQQKGAQFGGIANFNTGLAGIQAGGIANITIGNATGFQVAGIAKCSQ